MINKNNIFTSEITEEIKKWEKKFPNNKKASIIIPALHILQDYNEGYLTEDIINKLAQYLSVPKINIYEVAHFYSMYKCKKSGKYKINVCTNISCMLNGAYEILQYIEKKLNIKRGETSKNGMFTLQEVECQGACCGAPMLEFNKIFYENLTNKKIDKILKNLDKENA